MEKKLLQLQGVQQRWTEEDRQRAMQVNFTTYFLLLSDASREQELVSNVYKEYVFNINGQVGRSVIPEKPSAVIRIHDAYTAENYCKDFNEFLDQDDNNIYIFFILKDNLDTYPLSFLKHKKINLVEVPSVIIDDKDIIELLTLGENDLKKVTQNNCA